MPLPVVLVHGYSTEGETPPGASFTRATLQKLYGALPDDLEARGLAVVPVNLGRYISLDDGLGIDDISLAFDRALRSPEYASLLETGFNAIIHSTGALVMRNWVRRYWNLEKEGKQCPLKRLIHLAGANLGSGWAHIGQTQLAKFARMFQGTERGVAVLRALELASNWSIDMHTHFLHKGTQMLKDYGVMEFCLVGSQVPAEYVLIPIRYGKEDGSDGVVRVSASNLNFNYLRIEPTEAGMAVGWDDAVAYSRAISRRALSSTPSQAAFDSDYYQISFDSGPGQQTGGTKSDGEVRPRIPFAIPYNTCHSDAKIGIVSGTDNRPEILGLLTQIFNTDLAGYDALADAFDTVTAQTYQTASVDQHAKNFLSGVKNFIRNSFDDPHTQYDKHAQLVFRIRDQHGAPINDFSIFFNSLGGDQNDRPTQIINGLFEDKHKNDFTPNTINFYLRIEKFNPDTHTWDSQLPDINGVDIEIDATDAVTNRVVFLPIRLRVDANQLQKWLRPHRTTIVDVTMFRVPSSQAFMIR